MKDFGILKDIFTKIKCHGEICHSSKSETTSTSCEIIASHNTSVTAVTRDQKSKTPPSSPVFEYTVFEILISTFSYLHLESKVCAYSCFWIFLSETK